MSLFGPPDVEKLKAKGNAKGLIKALGYHKDNQVREKAIKALGEIGAVQSVEPLIAVLRNKGEDPSIRTAAAEALVRVGGSQSVEPLIAVFRDKDEDRSVRTTAIWAIADFGVGLEDAVLRERILALLVTTLEDKESSVSSAAAGALGGLGDSRGIEHLAAALKDSDGEARAAAVYALGKTGDARVVGLLIAALKDGYEYVRSRAAFWLGEIGDPQAVKPLIFALKDRVLLVRMAAVSALGQLGDLEAVNPLIAALDDQAVSAPGLMLIPTYRSEIARALNTLTGQDFGEDAIRWQRWWQNQQVSEAPDERGESVPAVITYLVQKSEVLSTDISGLSPVIEARIKATQESQSWFLLDLRVSGYDLDSRALWELPEVREWFELVSQKWPFLPYLLTRESCQLYLYCVMPVRLLDRTMGVDRVAIGGTPEAALKMQKMLDAGNELCSNELVPSDREQAEQLVMQATARIQAAMPKRG